MDEEKEMLITALRYAYLTLGYYATPYNYSDEAKVRHPLTGEVVGGIMFDNGEQAKEASEKIRALLPNYESILRL